MLMMTILQTIITFHSEFIYFYKLNIVFSFTADDRPAVSRHKHQCDLDVVSQTVLLTDLC